MFYFLWAVIYIIIFSMGAVLFSYLNLVIERLPKEESVLIRHTRCRFCDHEQMTRDVLPLISWIRFRGRCVYCGETFPIRPFLIELLGGILAIGSVISYGISWQALLFFLVLADMTVITFIDADTQTIPPELNVILLVLGIPAIWIFPGVGIVERLIGILSISVPMFVLVLLFNGFGGGDVKLMAASGFLLGWKGNVIAFFIGAILGGGYGIYLLASKKKGRKEYFAFGPFLCIGIAIALYKHLGRDLLQMYIDYLLSFEISG